MVASTSQAAGNSHSGQTISPELASFIQGAIQKGAQLELQHRTASWVSGSAYSHVDVEGSQLAEIQDPVPATAPSRGSSDHLSLADEDIRDQDLLDDEDLTPDQPSFVGLFKPQMFWSLLHKAKITTHLGSPRSASAAPGDTPAVPLFKEPVFEAEEIPGPKLFRDVL